MTIQIRYTRNLHTNPELGTGSTGWSGNIGTFSRVSEDAPPGTTFSAKLVSTGAVGNAIYAGFIGAAAGVLHSAAAQIKVPAGLQFRVYMQFWDAGSLLQNEYTLVTGTGGWQEITGEGLAPSGTTRMRFSIYANAAHTASSVFRMGAADYRAGPYVGPYLSGTQPGGMWEGTAHASTSVRIDSLSDATGRRLEVTVTEAGRDSPKRLPVNGIVRSERVNARGEASVEIETSDLRKAGLTDCRGYWLYIDTPDDLGTWGGVIQQIRHDGATGTTEVAAQTFEALLDKKRTAKTYEVADGDAGGIAKRVVVESAKDGSAFIDGYRIAPTGLVDISIRAEQVVDAVDQLAALADAEWRVTPSRWFEFAKRLGQDRTTTVLMEGRDLGAAWEVIRDLSPVVNDLAVMSAVTEYSRRTALVERDDESIEEIGQRQDTIVLPYMVKESVMRPVAKQELARMLRLGQSATLEVLNTHRAWSAFSAGDVVRLLIPSCTVDAFLRVLVRTWDSDSDRVVVTGEWSTVVPS